jgi:plastocyanin
MLRRKVSRLLAGAAVGALVALPLAPAVVTAAPAAVSTAQSPALAAAEEAAADQVLTFTGNNSVTAYASAPATATAGPATIVFENSAATGNNIGMSHTLTFDTTTPGYNHDVTLDILANPFDANGGRYEAEVNLTPGKYRYFCAIPGHGTMVGELVVTDAPADDTTAPTVTAEVAGQQDADGAYIGTATVALTAQDAESGVASVEYSVNGGAYQAYTEPFVLDQPGMYMVETRATDNAGNVSTPEMLHIEVVPADGEDTTAPLVSAEVAGELDSSGAYIASATVTVAAGRRGHRRRAHRDLPGHGRRGQRLGGRVGHLHGGRPGRRHDGADRHRGDHRFAGLRRVLPRLRHGHAARRGHRVRCGERRVRPRRRGLHALHRTDHRRHDR